MILKTENEDFVLILKLVITQKGSVSLIKELAIIELYSFIGQKLNSRFTLNLVIYYILYFLLGSKKLIFANLTFLPVDPRGSLYQARIFSTGGI